MAGTVYILSLPQTKHDQNSNSHGTTETEICEEVGKNKMKRGSTCSCSLFPCKHNLPSILCTWNFSLEGVTSFKVLLDTVNK